MRSFKPNAAMWQRVNAVIMDESMADVIITFISAMGQMLIQSGIVADENGARAHLAAMLLSPDTSTSRAHWCHCSTPFARLNHGKWIQ